jgi:hypothetical protein
MVIGMPVDRSGETAVEMIASSTTAPPTARGTAAGPGRDGTGPSTTRRLRRLSRKAQTSVARITVDGVTWIQPTKGPSRAAVKNGIATIQARRAGQGRRAARAATSTPNPITPTAATTGTCRPLRW